MLIFYIAAAAFILGGLIVLVSNYMPQRNDRMWY